MGTLTGEFVDGCGLLQEDSFSTFPTGFNTDRTFNIIALFEKDSIFLKQSS